MSGPGKERRTCMAKGCEEPAVEVHIPVEGAVEYEPHDLCEEHAAMTNNKVRDIPRADGGVMTAEQVEMESIRQHGETLHIDEVPSDTRSDVREEIVSTVEATLFLADLDGEVSEVYVYGSFAEGDALEMVSDLDVRVSVRSEDLDLATATMIEDEVRYAHSARITEETPFGFVDPKIVRAGCDADSGEVVL